MNNKHYNYHYTGLVLSCRFTIQRPKSGIKRIGFGVRNAGAVYLR